MSICSISILKNSTQNKCVRLNDYPYSLYNIPLSFLFGEPIINWNKKIAIVAGLRGDYHSRIGFKINPRIHARFTLAENTTLRIAAGSGFRAPNVLSENQSLLASSRRIVFQEN